MRKLLTNILTSEAMTVVIRGKDSECPPAITKQYLAEVDTLSMARLTQMGATAFSDVTGYEVELGVYSHEVKSVQWQISKLMEALDDNDYYNYKVVVADETQTHIGEFKFMGTSYEVLGLPKQVCLAPRGYYEIKVMPIDANSTVEQIDQYPEERSRLCLLYSNYCTVVAPTLLID